MNHFFSFLRRLFRHQRSDFPYIRHYNKETERLLLDMTEHAQAGPTELARWLDRPDILQHLNFHGDTRNTILRHINTHCHTAIKPNSFYKACINKDNLRHAITTTP
ncbi:MAG: hypothetical protein IJ581_07790 [Paludibacteraceae bacterium]|nr:hypothetical protein [Paludibacteraceae bacterium]